MGTILYHGSEYLIENPQFGKGSLHNDYGRGFYCTENIELAKEWPVENKRTAMPIFMNWTCLILNV